MGRRFTVIESFHSDELQREFVAGRTYETGGEDAMVDELIDKWVTDGKVSTVESEIDHEHEHEHEYEHEHEHEHEHEDDDEDDDKNEPA
jgi:hypothetical protein